MSFITGRLLLSLCSLSVGIIYQAVQRLSVSKHNIITVM